MGQNKIHQSKGRTRANMWRYVDWEQDGDQDIIVGVGDWSDYEWDHAYDAQGRWQNGPLHGWVYLIKNEGGEYTKNPVKSRLVAHQLTSMAGQARTSRTLMETHQTTCWSLPHSREEAVTTLALPFTSTTAKGP